MLNRRICLTALWGMGLIALLMVGLAAVRGGAAVPAAAGDGAAPEDAAEVRQRMERIIAFVDSPAYAEAATWDEFVVLAYQVTQGRPPTPLEFIVMNGFRDQLQMPRSGVLSIALRGQSPYPTWAQVRDFANRTTIASFRVTESVKETAQAIAAVPSSPVVDEMVAIGEGEALNQEGPPAAGRRPPQPGVEYNTYYGFLHAHSHLSWDAEGDADYAYEYARDTAGLDFFSLSDHGEFLMLWPWENKWQQLVDAAEASYLPGEFVSFWGFEWSNPVLGHVTIINSPGYTNAVNNFRLTALYQWLVARPEALGQFNHPGSYDYLFVEFHHLTRYAAAVPQMMGIENWNGSSSFDTYYYDGSWTSDYSYYDEGNRQGWYIGSLGAQDNHSLEWGTTNDFRTAVLAEALTRESLLDAFNNRRFYATEDKDLELDVRAQGFPMGSRLAGVPADFVVSMCDGSGDTFVEARLYRNGDLLQTQAVAGNCADVTLTDPAPVGDNYYYVIVRQNDDNDGNGRNDEAISSPIWISES